MNQTWLTFLQTQGAVVESGLVRHFGDPEAERKATAGGVVLVELSTLSLIRVRGADALTFLNGQLSNDVRRVDEEHSQFAAWCNPKGRALALLRVFRRPGMDECREGQESESGRRGEDYFLQLPGTLQESVLKRLRMFVLRAKVGLDNVDDELVSFGVAGPRAEALLRETFGELPIEINGCVTRNDVTILHVSAMQARYMVIAPVSAATELWQRLRPNARPVASDRWTWLDIGAGLPQIYPETSEAFVPQMFNLELLNGVDFKKGCYPGQEIVARLHYRGGLKQRMVRAHVDADAAPGMPLYAPDLPGQTTGAVVSAAQAPTGGYDLLAVIHLSSIAAGTVRLGDEHKGAPLKLLPLPYSLPVTGESATERRGT